MFIDIMEVWFRIVQWANFVNFWQSYLPTTQKWRYIIISIFVYIDTIFKGLNISISTPYLHFSLNVFETLYIFFPVFWKYASELGFWILLSL